MTKIEWASAGLGKGATWNPIRARNRLTGKTGWFCEHVSPACENCYAERMNMKLGASGGTGLPYKPGHRKDVEIYLDEKTLLAPLKWRTPREIFVCSMTDAFADFVPDEWLNKLFAIAALCPQHRFLFLTKRPKRMREYFATLGRFSRILEARVGLPSFDHAKPDIWPLPNAWLGTTVEDQPRAEERRDDLGALAAQGWTTFVSYEPALGQIDWCGWEFVKQIISGGESGPEAWPSHPDWHISTRDFCAENDIAYFFKQWGEWHPCEMVDGIAYQLPGAAPFDSWK